MTFRYAPGFPIEVRDMIEPTLHRWAHILPGWLHTVRVAHTTDNSSTLSTSVRAEYRFAYLYVHPEWIAQSVEEREEDVVHEFLHAALQPLSDLSDTLIEQVADEETPFRAWCDEELRRRLEGAVCDLVRVVRGAA